MAGTRDAHTPEAAHYVDYEEYVDYQLEKTRATVKRTDILLTLTALAVAVTAYLLAFVVFDQWVISGGFGYGARVALLAVLSSFVLGTLARKVLWPLLRRVHPLYAARVIEQSDPNLKSNLVNFVDVRQANAQSAPIVLKAMEKRAAVELSHINVEEAVDHRPLLRVAYALLAIVVASALYIVFSPKDPFASVRRALLPTAPIEVATETTITEVAPGEDSDVPARASVTVEANVRGKDADHVQLFYTTADHKYVDEPIEMRRIEGNPWRFGGVLNGENGRGLLQSLTYRIAAGDARTRDFKINVIQPPSARVDDVHYVFPTYMRFPEKTTEGGHIDGWEGATVTVNATANMPVKEATICLTDAEDLAANGLEQITMKVSDGTRLSASWRLEFRQDGTAPRFYHIAVKNAKGETDRLPAHYTLRIRPDQRPEVALLSPSSDLTMPANGVIPLVIQAADPDFQLRSITLKTERNGEMFPDQRLFEDQELEQVFRGSHDFRLEGLRLAAGETIQLWIEVKDNKQPTANRANTPRINVHIGKPASAAEIEKQLAEEKKKQDQIASADDALNPGEREKQPQRGGEGDDAEKSEERPERPEPGDQTQRNEKTRPVEDGGDDAAKQDRGDEGQSRQKPSQPSDFQDAIQKLLQKDRQEKSAEQNEDQNSDEREQQSPDEKQAGKSNTGKGNTQGEQPDQRRSQSAKKPGNDSSNSESSAKEDNSGKNRDERGADGKKQKADGSKSRDQQEAAGKKSDEAGNGRARPDESQSKNTESAAKKKSGDKDQPSGDSKDKDDEAHSDKHPSDSQPKSDEGADKAGQTRGAKNRDDKKSNPADKPARDNEPGDQESGDDQSPSSKKSGSMKKDDAGKTADDQVQENPGKNGNKKDSKDASATDDNKPGARDDKPSAGEDKAAEQKNQKQGGAGKESPDKPDSAPDASDSTKASGSRGKSDKPEGDQQQGDGDGQKSKKKGGEGDKSGSDSDADADQKPAASSPDAKKKQATGNETGEAEGDKEGDPNAPKAQNEVKRKPGSEPGAKSKSSSDDKPEGAKRERNPKSEEGTSSGTENPEHADRPADDKKPTDQPPELDDPASKPAERRKDSEGEKRPGQPPDAGNQDLRGPGRKEGQKADQSDTGEEGSSTATDQGKKGGNKRGAGDKSDEPGNTDPSAEKTGQSGDKKGKGSSTRPTDDEGQKQRGAGEESGDDTSKSGEKSKSKGKEGASEEGKGDPGQKEGSEGKSSDKSGKKGGKSGASGKSDSKGPPGKSEGESSAPGAPGQSGQRRSGGGISSRPGEGNQPGEGPGDAPGDEDVKPRDADREDDPPTPEEEQAKLEYARKATNLVLKRLKEKLERGEADQELLDELGWKDKRDIERFVKFLEQGLNQPDDDNSPDAVARRLQFEETLKSLRLENESGKRSGGAGSSREIKQIGIRNNPVPPEYRRAYEAYTKSLSKSNGKAAGKAKSDGKTKPSQDK